MSRLSSSLGNTMKTMTGRTLIALGVASCLGIGTAVYAQTNATALPPPPSPPAATPPGVGHSLSEAPSRGQWRARMRLAMRWNRMKRLAHRLRLDPTQRLAFRHIHAKAMAEIWAARADEHLTADERGARIKAAVEAGRTEFRNMLAPEQREKLDRIENRRARTLLGM